MTAEFTKDEWPGQVCTVTIGATAPHGGTRSKAVVVGGQKSMPFLAEAEAMPHPPVTALEIHDRRPDHWSQVLLDFWGEHADSPGRWAQAAEAAGASLLQLTLSLEAADGMPNSPERAVAAVQEVLGATGLPLMVFGPGQAEADNELLVPVAEAAKGERLVLGICEDSNYRTMVAAALANDHLVSARAPMDVNLSKQLNILITDMGLPRDRILMDPTTGALGYGIEYGYSVMERLRLAALQGDAMTQLPLLVGVGAETWKTKEAKVGEDVPESWGGWEARGIHWETLTALALLEAGADVLVLRHPESLSRIKVAIHELSTIAEPA